MAFSFVAHSQTKEETIKWLEDKMTAYSWWAGKIRVTEIIVTECEITAIYEDGDKTTFSTTSFDCFKRRQCLCAYDKKGKRRSDCILSKHVPDEVREKIEKAIKHLATFCNDDDLF